MKSPFQRFLAIIHFVLLTTTTENLLSKVTESKGSYLSSQSKHNSKKKRRNKQQQQQQQQKTFKQLGLNLHSDLAGVLSNKKYVIWPFSWQPNKTRSL